VLHEKWSNHQFLSIHRDPFRLGGEPLNPAVYLSGTDTPGELECLMEQARDLLQGKVGGNARGEVQLSVEQGRGLPKMEATTEFQRLVEQAWGLQEVEVESRKGSWLRTERHREGQ